MEFRSNFFIQIFGTLIQFTVTIVFFKVIFLYTYSIGGWDLNKTLLLVGTNNLIDILYTSFFGKNIQKISSLIRKGDLDIILLKPIDEQFFISTRFINFSSLFSIIFPFILIFYVFLIGKFNISLFKIIIYIFLILCGLTIRYVFGFVIMLLSFWLTQIGALHSLYSDFFSLAGYPISIYKGIVRYFFIFIIPIIVISNFSVMSILQILNPLFIVYAFCISVLLLYISKLCFNYSVKFYTSASS